MRDAVTDWLDAAARAPLLTHRDEIEMARLQALEPAAWADGVAAVSSRCGLRSARGRRILDTLRAA